MKKLLMLGGANSQIPAIKRAIELGYYVISCDYLPDNPGHAYSHEYINVSTINKEEVLKIAQEKKIDGIIAYASDPSAETAAYVIDRLSLHGADLKSTKILAEKDLFRKFQKEEGFSYPDFIICSGTDSFNKLSVQILLPCVVKPVDSSGSKGVSIVDVREKLFDAYHEALRFSKSKKVIFERFINTRYCQLHGDGFVYDNKLVFMELGDQRFHNCVPIGSSLPSAVKHSIKERAWEEVSRLVTKVGFKSGGINVEIRVGEDEKLYIIEIGPRTGGNYVPQLMENSTGFEEMSAVLKVAMGDWSPTYYKRTKAKYCFQYIIGARTSGFFQEIWVNPQIRSNIKELYIHKETGCEIECYENSSGVVGVAILLFETKSQMEHVIAHIDDYIRSIIRGKE